MMRQGWKLAILAMILPAFAACTPSSDSDDPVDRSNTAATPEPTDTAATEPATGDAEGDLSEALTSLAGEWRVAAIDGAEFDEKYGLALSADDGRLWFEPACVAQERNYTINGLSFAATAPGASSDRVICDIAVPDRLAEVWRAIDAAERVERTPGNGVMISGGGRSLLLFAQ